MPKIPSDKRTLSWNALEKEVQHHGLMKDAAFRLEGPWKTFVREQDGLRVFAVDGTWIRNNLSVIFGHGGHGFAHEFIPFDEIWIGTHHYGGSLFNSCSCDISYPNQPVSQAYFDSTALHEIVERKEMERDIEYWPAHQTALEAERVAGYLPDPYSDRI
jgi:hypothetical protein